MHETSETFLSLIKSFLFDFQYCYTVKKSFWNLDLTKRTFVNTINTSGWSQSWCYKSKSLENPKFTSVLTNYTTGKRILIHFWCSNFSLLIQIPLILKYIYIYIQKYTFIWFEYEDTLEI